MVLRVILALLAGLGVLVAALVGLSLLLVSQILAADPAPATSDIGTALAAMDRMETLRRTGIHLVFVLSFLGGALTAGCIARGHELSFALILWVVPAMALIANTLEGADFTPLSLIATTLAATLTGGLISRQWRRWRAGRAARAQLAVF